MPLRFFWTGTLVTPAGRVGITREALEWFDETPPASPIDADGALNLELAYQAIVDTLVAGGDAFTANFEGGTVEVLDVATNQRAIKFKKNNVLLAILSAYKDASAHSFNIDVKSVQDDDSFFNLSVTAPEGKLATNSLTLHKGEATVGKFELKSTDAEVNFAYLSDVIGLMLNGSDAPVISDGWGVDIDGKILRLRTSKTPASSADTGNDGEICADDTYLYRYCTSQWKRIAWSTF